MTLTSYLAAVPKVELHVHIEGSMTAETIFKLAARNNISLPVATPEALKKWFAVQNWERLREAFELCRSCLQTAADYELLAYDFGAEMARQHIRYAEVTFSPSACHRRGVGKEIYLDGLNRGREQAQRDFGVTINWIFIIARNIENPLLRAELANFTTQLAIAEKANGVVALGLAHYEPGFPPELFTSWFEQAGAAGLGSVPHAGELSGPESVWGAITALQANRIGHGVRAIEDPTLIEYLAENKIPLDICPTSNIKLGVYPDINQHPLRHLYEAGVTITINSDDPPLFNTTLNEEVLLLAESFGLSVEEIDDILLNGVRYSFLPPAARCELETTFRAEMDTLKAIHLSNV